MQKRYAGAALRGLNNLIRRRLDQQAKHEDAPLTGVQAMLLHDLAMRKQPCVQRDLELRFRMRPSTVSGVLQLLEQRGLIERVPMAHDGRCKRIVLTAQAHALNTQIVAKLRQMEDQLCEGIAPEALDTWFAVCRQMRANLERTEEKEEDTLW